MGLASLNSSAGRIVLLISGGGRHDAAGFARSGTGVTVVSSRNTIATLIAEDVAGYDGQVLDDDYRHEVLWHITNPVWQWSIRIPPVIWWNNIKRVFLAVDDLRCRGVAGLMT